MTSVNSPACLLARNHFYRKSPSPEPIKQVFSHHANCSTRQKQRQITLWVTMATPPGFPVTVGSKGLWVSIALGSSSSPRLCTSKPADPADRNLK